MCTLGSMRLVEDYNLVGIEHGANPLRHDQGGMLPDLIFQCRLIWFASISTAPVLSSRIKMWGLVSRARAMAILFLPTRQVYATCSSMCVIALG